MEDLEQSPKDKGKTGGFQLVQREVLLLVVIAVAAIPLYLFTFRMAEINRQRNSGIAASLYKQAQRQLAAHDTKGAIESLREAVTNDRNDRQLAFALATTLAAAGKDEEARNALLRLRDATPEDPKINVQLARLSARQSDIPEATRYYHHSLYGVWTGANIESQRREVRLELIHLLMANGNRNQALAELLVMGSEAPRTAEAQLELAGLFNELNDGTRALDHYLAAAAIDPKNFDAQRGAGETAFRLGDYRAAARYLAQALGVAPKEDAPAVTTLLDVARKVESLDPLAPRISTAERLRRLSAALDRVAARLGSCIDAEKNGGAFGPLSLEKLQGDARAMRTAVTMNSLRRDPELLRAGADLVFALEETAAEWCGEPEGADRALLLAGRKHEGGER